MHYLDCTAPFQLQFVTNGIAQDTKATGTDQPQRGNFFVSHRHSGIFSLVWSVTELIIPKSAHIAQLYLVVI